ncbi:YggT family protein [Acetobacteraceae bacterium ESL0709]|nr:YggT family protein [Acetobacteraceae bacterium ESL0697]MDF7677178.1 YggT family protein [Acetobacteraceae bacterium ESL0709]
MVSASPFLLILLKIIFLLCDIYTWIILAYCLLSMVLAFGLADSLRTFFFAAYNVCARLVEPVLRPIRSILPDTGMVDLSPLILILFISYGVPFILQTLIRLVAGM